MKAIVSLLPYFVNGGMRDEFAKNGGAYVVLYV